MTRPPTPQDYGAVRTKQQPQDYGAKAKAAPASTVRREYFNPVTREPYEGRVLIYRKGILVLTVGLVKGVLDVPLPAGAYHFTAEVTIDGVVRYLDQDVIV